jgi:thioredoxin reductase (NADPH)
MTTTWVENWPGVEKMLGPDIIRRVRQQAERFGARMTQESIVDVDLSTWPFMLQTDSGKTISALSVIITTGSTPRTLGIPGEQMYWGRGVTTCAICDAPFFKNERVCVVGGGDSAVEEAIQLAPYAREITIFVRKDRMRAAPAMQERLQAYDTIRVQFDTDVTAIHGDDDQVTSIDIMTKGQRKTIPMDGLFLAIGHDPNTKVFKPYIACDDQGYITPIDRSQKTSRSGVFVAGDVADKVYKQAGVAAGNGIKAALDASEHLVEIGYDEDRSRALEESFYDPYIDKMRESIPTIETNEAFEKQVLQAEKPVFVDFYTDHCPSCLQMMPAVEYIAYRYKDSVDFYKIDALQLRDIAKKYNITSVPRLLLLKDGIVQDERKKALTKNELDTFIQSNL